MGTTVVTTETIVKAGPDLGSGGGNGFRGNGGRGPDRIQRDQYQPEKYRIGMWAALASIMMLFVALTSAYIFRYKWRGQDGGTDWVALTMPRVLWLNTVVILLSSLTVDIARRAFSSGAYGRFKRYMSLSTILGGVFLVGQFIAFKSLVAQGIFMRSNPHSSFFYLLTGLHGLHLIGGIAAMCFVTLKGIRRQFEEGRAAAVEITALYWHFMDGLWVYLFLLLFFWK